MAALLWCAPGVVLAHVVYERTSLRQWAQQAVLIIVAEITEPLHVWSAADGSDHQEVFTLRVIEVIAGTPPAESFRVFPHAEGAPLYEAGDRALLFLDRSGSRAEFASLAADFPYFTAQGAGQEWKLDVADPSPIEIARAWRGLAADPDYASRRDLLLHQLASGYAQLRAEAIADLMRLRVDQEFRADPVAAARLAEMAAQPRRSLAERIGIVRTLNGVGGFSTVAALTGIAAEVGEGSGRAEVVRAFAGIRDPHATEFLRQQLAAGDVATQVAALSALADPWHAAAVADIAGLAQRPDTESRVAMAAVRALAGIGDDPARSALLTVAAGDSGALAAIARRHVTALDRRRGEPR